MSQMLKKLEAAVECGIGKVSGSGQVREGIALFGDAPENFFALGKRAGTDAIQEASVVWM